MTTMAGETSITRLAEKFELLGLNTNRARVSFSVSDLPDPLLIYKAGGILFNTRQSLLHDNSKDERLAEIYQRLWIEYDHITQNLPYNYAIYVWECITETFTSLLSNQRSNKQADKDDDIINNAIQFLCGCFIHSHTACQQAFTSSLCESLVSLYHDRLNFLPSNPSQHIIENQTVILSTLSHLVTHGLILPLQLKQSANPDDLLHQIMDTVLHCFGGHAHSYCLGDLHCYQQEEMSKKYSFDANMSQPFKTMVNAIQETFPLESPQRDYLIQLIELAPSSGYSTMMRGATHSDSLGSNNAQKTLSPPVSVLKYSSTLERNIDTVHSILPHLGRGYIEVALSCYQNDPEQTIAILLESESNTSILHPRIKDLDPRLPAKKEDYSISETQEKEARQKQKVRVQAMEAQLEKEAYHLQLAMTDNRHGEYEDDYDDQYDDMGDDGGNIGGTDVGIYDADFDAIRTYNRIAREIESEDAFWNDMKNTNRPGTSQGSVDGEGQGKRYSGPDKGKGGRILEPKDGRSIPSSRQTHENSEVKRMEQDVSKIDKDGTHKEEKPQTMTKIEKRRKNTQKSHHNRKDRATRKATHGMI